MCEERDTQHIGDEEKRERHSTQAISDSLPLSLSPSLSLSLSLCLSLSLPRSLPQVFVVAFG